MDFQLPLAILSLQIKDFIVISSEVLDLKVNPPRAASLIWDLNVGFESHSQCQSPPGVCLHTKSHLTR